MSDQNKGHTVGTKDFFSDKPYPGRFLIVGRDVGRAVVIYGATGRSPSSLARRFVEQGDGIYMAATDATVAIAGNPDLLEYPALKFFDNGILAANGNHIELIESLNFPNGVLEELGGTPESSGKGILSEVTYEPDEYKTPRITGCILETDGGLDALLHIVRSAKSLDPHRDYWRVSLKDGSGSYISTYTGEDVRPTPSFSSDPLPVSLHYGSAGNAAQGVYDALEPQAGKSDYRVGVIAAYKEPGKEPEISIINRLV